MIELNFCLFGGRGGSSGLGAGGGGTGSSSSSSPTFSNVDELDAALSGASTDNPLFKEFESGLNSTEETTAELTNLTNQVKETGEIKGFTKQYLENEKTKIQNELSRMPEKKTPQQLGREQGLKDQIELINKSLNYKGSGTSASNTSITT